MINFTPTLDPTMITVYSGLGFCTLYITEAIKLIFSKKIKNNNWYDLISLLIGEVLVICATLALEPFSQQRLLSAAIFAIPITHTSNKVFDYISKYLPFIKNTEDLLKREGFNDSVAGLPNFSDIPVINDTSNTLITVGVNPINNLSVNAETIN